MKKYFFGIVFIMAVSLFMGCQSKQEKDHDKLLRLEKALNDSAASFDKAKAIELRNAYLEYIKSWPQDSMNAAYTFKGAEFSMSLREFQKAIELFQRYYKAWPENPKAADCLFLVGFIYENELKNYNEARNSYAEFIQKYPQHPYADDAEILIQNLGKSPEELIREFEAKNAEKSEAKN